MTSMNHIKFPETCCLYYVISCISSSGINKPWHLKMRTINWLQMSVWNYQHSLCNNPEEARSLLPFVINVILCILSRSRSNLLAAFHLCWYRYEFPDKHNILLCFTEKIFAIINTLIKTGHVSGSLYSTWHEAENWFGQHCLTPSMNYFE